MADSNEHFGQDTPVEKELLQHMKANIIIGKSSMATGQGPKVSEEQRILLLIGSSLFSMALYRVGQKDSNFNF